MKRWILSLGLALTAACAGSTSEDGSSNSTAAATGAINEQPAGAEDGGAAAVAAPSLMAFSSFGLCRELAEALGQSDTTGVRLPGTITCYLGFGVDGFSLWGDVSAGYPHAVAREPTVVVNGQTVAAMDVEIFGEPARALFDALTGATVTAEVINGRPTRTSQQGNIRCNLLDSSAICTLQTMVSFAAGREDFSNR